MQPPSWTGRPLARRCDGCANEHRSRRRWRALDRIRTHGQAILGSIDIALAKAKTSILFNGPSENLWEYCKPGGPAPATEHTNGGLIPYAGGVALNNEDGELIGAIGVSGGLPEQDGEVARAGAGD